MPLFASAIDPGAHANIRDQNIAFAGGILHGTDIYVFCVTQIPHGFDAYKSTDGGSTWNRMDHANAPGERSCNIYFDGADTVTVCAVDPTAFPYSQIKLYRFDLATDTWSAPFATLGPHAQITNSVWIRPGGSILIIYDAGNPRAAGKAGSSRLWSVVWDGANWVNDLDTGVLGIAENLIVTSAASIMDATGRVHIFFSNFAYSRVFYQARELDNTLGSSHEFTGTVFSTTQGATPYGLPAIVAGQIVFPISDSSIAIKVFVGNALVAPVWTLSASIDSVVTAPSGTPNCVYNAASGITGVSILDASSVVYFADRLRIAQTSNLVTWTAATFYQLVPSPANMDVDGFSKVWLSATNLTGFLTGQYFNTAQVSSIAFFIGSFQFSAVSPPAPYGVPLTIIDGNSLQPITTGSIGQACTPSLGRVARDPRKPIRGFTS